MSLPDLEGAATSKPGPRPATDTLPGEGLYVYAIAPGPLPADQLGSGIDGARLETVSAMDGTVAVVHAHSAPPFEGADSDVERWILEHGQVVERAWETTGTVLPMSFNVIVAPGQQESARERLAGWMDSASAVLGQRLAALRDRVELRIEISLEQQTAAEGNAEVAELRQSLVGRPAGVGRLMQKRVETMQRAATEELADTLYPDYRRRLAAHCEELVENRRARPSPGFTPILTVSVLVPQDGVQDVGLELTAIGEEQPAAQIRFLGPWPPYSFAEVPQLDEV